MHIPDGFLDGKTLIATASLSIAGLTVAVREANKAPSRRVIPLMGVTAAFVFAAQMVNFPVAAGTSGHLMGAALVTILLGPGSAIIVMTAVLTVQALLFADGGLLALGANIFNIAVVGSVVAHGIYSGVRKVLRGEFGRLAAIGFAGWCSMVIASAFCAGELAWAGTAPWDAAFPAMVTVHMLIGFGEAAVTMLVVAAIGRARPELLDGGVGRDPGGAILYYGLLVALGVATVIAPFAVPWPDGLERVAETLGIEARGTGTGAVPSPFADYRLPGIGSPAAGTALAGGLGTVVAFGFSLLLARILVRRSGRSKRGHDSQ